MPSLIVLLCALFRTPMSKNPRIAYIANVRMPTEKAHGYQIMKMCEALAEEGATVTIFCPRRWQTNPRISIEESPFVYYGVRSIFTLRYVHNWDVVRIERFAPSYIFPFLFYCHSALWGVYALFVARKDADVIYLRDDVPIAVMAALLGIPFVYEMHRIPAGLGRLAIRFLRSRSLRCVATLTEHIRNRLVGEFGFDGGRVMVLPDGVDMRLFDSCEPRDVVRREAGLPTHERLVGYVGTFTALGYEKGVDCLVHAMARVRALYPDARLVCVGGPDEIIPQYRRIAAHAGVLNAVYFTGRVHPYKAASWMRACDILVIPLPYNEFFAYHTSPLKLFEYMASGVPMVVSDLPSLREIVSEKEVIFAAPGDVESLAVAIGSILLDQAAAQRRAVNARHAVNAYSWQFRACAVLRFI